MRWVGILNDLGFWLAAVLSELQRNHPLRQRPDLSRRGPFFIATAGGFGGGGTTFVAPGFTVPAENNCTQWSGFTKTASTVILTTSGAACRSSTGKTLTVRVSSVDLDFLGTNQASDYIQLTRASSTGSFSGGTDQGQFAGSADQVTCTSGLLSLPDVHD